MPDRSRMHPRRHRQAGFSLVELLVALVFTALLMAGMAKVYQSSINTFYRTSESISSGRRNRMALDLLYDDLDAAGQYLTNLTAYPAFSATNPGFYIVPNQAYTGTDVPTAQALTDQLTFYMDVALPFEGRLYDPTAGAGGTYALTSNDDLVKSQANLATLDTTMQVKFQDPAYAKMVSNGMVAVFKDQWGPTAISNVSVSGSTVSFKPNAVQDTSQGLPTGINPLNRERHFAGTGDFTKPATGGAPVLFVQPAQMVRYLVKAENLDPAQPTVGVPCLVRQQGNYDPTGFTVSTESVIAEDVTGFKVYLSVYPDPAGDVTKTWAGWGSTANTFADGWTNGILASINTQLGSLGLPSVQNANDPNWFRNVPLIVRIDLTTRSTVKRSENSATGTTPAYQYQTRILYMVPRHFGLSFN